MPTVPMKQIPRIGSIKNKGKRIIRIRLQDDMRENAVCKRRS